MGRLVRTRRIVAGSIVVWALSVVLVAHAAPPVEERNRTAQQGSPRAADLFYQIQQLQQEIMELRGQLEEQSYRLRRLEKQRLEDYENLDKRLREGSQGSSRGSSSAAANGSTASSKSESKSASSSSSKKVASSAERDAYQNAFQQLKKQQLDAAQVSFEAFISTYPDGQYTANAYYWLGELYLTESNLPKARGTFGTLVTRYPDFRKTPESSFKLAKIYDQMGDQQKSKSLLQKIVREYGQKSPSTVSQASAYLDEHFR
jgi:tol-pal system protein YbgF